MGFINGCEKDQLVEMADHYGIVVAAKNRKEEIRKAVLLSLFERGVLHKSELDAAAAVPAKMPVSVPAVVQTAGLTFEQQKELLALQFEQEMLRSLSWRNFSRKRGLESRKVQMTVVLTTAVV